MTATKRTKPWLELRVIMARDGHWTYASLGKAAGLSDEYVRLLEKGERTPTVGAIRRLSNALKVPYSVLEPPVKPVRRAFSPAEVAEMLGITLESIAELIGDGRLRAQKVRSDVLIPDTAIDRLFSDITEPTGDTNTRGAA